MTVHHQAMQELRLDRGFRSIFLAGPSFNLIPADDTALAALRSILDVREIAPDDPEQSRHVRLGPRTASGSHAW